MLGKIPAVALESFTAEMCEELFIAKKYTASRIAWKGIAADKLSFKAQVLTHDGRGLDLAGWYAKAGRGGKPIWGFSLYYRGHCIRSYDMSKYHKNPQKGGKARGPHKHRFSSSRIPRFAYKPDPAIRETNPNDALMDFLAEANIEMRSEYQMLLI